MYTKEQIQYNFENEKDATNKIYILCHLFVDSLLIFKEKENITIKEYYESFIFTCYHIIDKFSSSNKDVEEEMTEKFFLLITDELTTNKLFDNSISAIEFVAKRFVSIISELSEDKNSENYLMPILVNNLYFNPFNEDACSTEEELSDIVEKIPFEFMLINSIKLKKSIEALRDGSNDVVKLMFQ